MGPHDLVRRVAAELGVEEVFWGVAVKPGKPLAFGIRDQTLVFGLPGNPVSSLVGALVFVGTALRARQGMERPEPSYLSGVAARRLFVKTHTVTSSSARDGSRRTTESCSTRSVGRSRT